jgi:ubiquinone/menaquinone biosynthesis C-methylase UbiE
MDRILERQIMDDQEQALAYAAADFSSSNQMFVDRLLARYRSQLRTVLDIGCGPGDVPIRLARAHPALRITAVDASEAMLRLADTAVRNAGLDDRINLVQSHVPGLPGVEGRFDAILAKDLLHHLPDPMVFWDEVKRLARGRVIVYVMDLFRPESERAARDIVESVSASEPEILKTDFYNSLLAAFTVDEVAEQLRRAECKLTVAAVSERHLLVDGVLGQYRR